MAKETIKGFADLHLSVFKTLGDTDGLIWTQLAPNAMVPQAQADAVRRGAGPLVPFADRIPKAAKTLDEAEGAIPWVTSYENVVELVLTHLIEGSTFRYHRVGYTLL